MKLLTTQNGSATGAREIVKRLAFTCLDKEALNSCPRASNDLSHQGNISEVVEEGDFIPFSARLISLWVVLDVGRFFAAYLSFPEHITIIKKRKIEGIRLQWVAIGRIVKVMSTFIVGFTITFVASCHFGEAGTGLVT